MSTIPEQIELIEKELRETPHHKATNHYIGMLRAKLSRLKDRELEKSSKKSGGGESYNVKKQGDATIVLVGPPSAGKSTLINKLTNAQSKVAPYAFTTVAVIPGMFIYNDARIQILDVPGLIEGAEEGKGRGREVLSVARGTSLIILISDIHRPKAIFRINNALEKNGIRINKTPPETHIEKKHSGGIIIHSNIRQELDKQTIKDVANEFGIKNAEITIREKLTIERLIDSFSANRVYIPAIFVLNKADEMPKGKKNKKENEYLYISAENNLGMKELKNIVWEKLGFVRIYLIKPNEEPHLNNPIIMKKNETLINAAEKIGSDFLENKKRAKIWGNGSKFPGQEVSLDTKVQAGMQVRFL